MSFDDFQLFACSPVPTDFGDAAGSYGTTIAQDGPRHLITGYDAAAHTSTLMLGSKIDDEAEGVPAAAADGDDTAGVDDEDAVGAIQVQPGQTTTVSVAATNSTGTAATLAGWIDLDGDGTFETTEGVTANVPANSGAGTYQLTFPAGTTSVPGYARFRLFPDTVANPLPTGAAVGGEVEDHPFTVPVPGQCDGSAYSFIVLTGGTTTRIQRVSADGTSITVIATAPYALNAVGYNQRDGYLYGLRQTANGYDQLARINPTTGAVQLLDVIPGTPAGGFDALAAMNGDNLYLERRKQPLHRRRDHRDDRRHQGRGRWLAGHHPGGHRLQPARRQDLRLHLAERHHGPDLQARPGDRRADQHQLHPALGRHQPDGRAVVRRQRSPLRHRQHQSGAVADRRRRHRHAHHHEGDRGWRRRRRR